MSKISKNGRHKPLSYSKSLKDVKSLVNGLDPILSKTLGKNILTPNEIYDNYKEAACQYAKVIDQVYVKPDIGKVRRRQSGWGGQPTPPLAYV